MQRGMAVVIAAAAALTTGAVLGVAGAQQSTPAAPAAPEQRLISVTGAGESTVPVAAGVGARQAAYRDALGAALDDANAKAAFVAQRVGLVVGAVQSVTEQSSAPLSFCGAAYAESGTVARPKRRVARKPASKTAPKAAQDEPSVCDVPAAVTVAYAATGP
jgi:uncharacterized protein YggE